MGVGGHVIGSLKTGFRDNHFEITVFEITVFEIKPSSLTKHLIFVSTFDNSTSNSQMFATFSQMVKFSELFSNFLYFRSK